MSGILLLSMIAAWFYVVKKLAQFCVKKMQEGQKKRVVYIVVFVLLCIAPVADEVVGGFEFRSLCKKGNSFIYDPHKLGGRTGLWDSEPRKEIKNTLLPIKGSVVYWVDPETTEKLVKYKTYYATGGWLSRWIGFNSVTRPYTFTGYCSGLKEQRRMFEKKFNLILN